MDYLPTFVFDHPYVSVAAGIPAGLFSLYVTFRLVKGFLGLAWSGVSKIRGRKSAQRWEDSVLAKAESAVDAELANALTDVHRLRTEIRNRDAYAHSLELALERAKAMRGTDRVVEVPVRVEVPVPAASISVPNSKRVDYRFKCLDCRKAKRGRVAKGSIFNNNKGARTIKLRCKGCYRAKLVRSGMPLDKANKRVKRFFERIDMTFDNQRTVTGLDSRGRSRSGKSTAESRLLRAVNA